MSRIGEIGQALYSGKVSIDFVGKRNRWYFASLVILLVCIASLSFKQLNFGIEFRGGNEFIAQVDSPGDKIEEFTDAVVDTEIEEAANPVVVSSGTEAIRVTTEPLTTDETIRVSDALQEAGATEVSESTIGPSWGQSIAEKAVTGLIVFLVLVVLFIWAYFREWKMSLAAIVALAHDVLITVGVYSLSGFEVTPATVTGLLTILGFSLYDTVVVFDKVRENTRGILTSTRATYAERANLAVNQTLVRSINTSVAALIPVGAILYVGVFQLGTGPLKDLALALFVGMAAGAYSSIFIATPLVVQLKEREPAIQEQARRVHSRRAAQAREAGRVTVPAESEPTADDEEAPDESSPAPATTSTSPSSPAKARQRPRSRPMSSTAAKRAQPQRQSRSKRSR